MSKENQPLYHKVKEGLIDIIGRQSLKPGDPLPTEAELEAMFGVSRTTIRTAINELQHEGYLVKQQGRGTFVANNSYAECTALLQGFYEDAKQRGGAVSSLLIAAELVIPDEEVQEMLGIGREEVLRWRTHSAGYLLSYSLFLRKTPLERDRFYHRLPVCRNAEGRDRPG